MQKPPKPHSVAHSLTRTKNLECVADMMERYKKKRSGGMRQGEMRNALPGIILPSLNHEELRMLPRLTTENKL